MERKTADESEPGPVPLLVPVDRFGFLKQEYGNSSPQRFTKTRSSSNYDKQLRLLDDSHHVSSCRSWMAKTNIMHELPSYITWLVILGFRILGLLQSPNEGAESIIDAALSTPETSGAYYFGGKGRIIESSQVSRDPKLAKQLWETSCDLFNELQLLQHNN